MSIFDGEPTSLVVTARPDPVAFQYFDAMRRSFFPDGRNKVPAHISLFHNFPAGLLEPLAADIAEILPSLSPDAEATAVRFLGRGVAYAISAPGLQQLHAALSTRYADRLIPQDRQRYSPHITVQNKADPDQARALSDRLTAEFAPRRLILAAVDVWFYLADGTWRTAATVPWKR